MFYHKYTLHLQLNIKLVIQKSSNCIDINYIVLLHIGVTVINFVQVVTTAFTFT